MPPSPRPTAFIVYSDATHMGTITSMLASIQPGGVCGGGDLKAMSRRGWDRNPPLMSGSDARWGAGADFLNERMAPPHGTGALAHANEVAT